MSDFFSVGLAEFRLACDIDLNAAVSFLILACGTGPDNRTTSWSANAVQTYAHISWQRAKPAIKKLENAKLLEMTGKSSRPRYILATSETVVWLPKSIVIPLGSELPPVARIREAQDVELLRLFIELYYSQNISADFGFSRSIVYREYEKSIITELGAYVYIGFVRRDVVAHVDFLAIDHPGADSRFFQSEKLADKLELLHELGLFEYSSCVFESENIDSEILFPLSGPEEVECVMGLEADLACQRSLDFASELDEEYDFVIPVFRHLERVEVYGIFRLRHRPKTALTASWWGKLHTAVASATEALHQISPAD